MYSTTCNLFRHAGDILEILVPSEHRSGGQEDEEICGIREVDRCSSAAAKPDATRRVGEWTLGIWMLMANAILHGNAAYLPFTFRWR